MAYSVYQRLSQNKIGWGNHSPNKESFEIGGGEPPTKQQKS